MNPCRGLCKKDCIMIDLVLISLLYVVMIISSSGARKGQTKRDNTEKQFRLLRDAG